MSENLGLQWERCLEMCFGVIFQFFGNCLTYFGRVMSMEELRAMSSRMGGREAEAR
jgi:hypothetical protein